MAVVTICNDFGAPKKKVCHCFHCLSIYLPWSDGTRCHDLSFLNVECLYLQKISLRGSGVEVTSGVTCPSPPLGTFGDVWCGVCWHLVGRGQGRCWIPYSAQQPPTKSDLAPDSTVPRSRTWPHGEQPWSLFLAPEELIPQVNSCKWRLVCARQAVALL